MAIRANPSTPASPACGGLARKLFEMDILLECIAHKLDETDTARTAAAH
jgi:hypothetical protein